MSSLRRSSINAKQRGFTLVELVVVMAITGILATTFYSFFKTTLFGYFDLQKSASNFTNLAAQSHRIAGVVRGTTDIIAITNDSVEVYAYFFPTDTYVSDTKYYLDATSTKLLADVTPMTANPPIGTQITSKKKTYTIISSFKKVSGINTFEYISSTYTTMPLPITDLHTIKGIRINLAVNGSSSATNQAVSVEVSLRNRKTNL